MASQRYDVLIVGGGPAGLSAAAGLARQLHTALVIDSGVYRNARAKHMHNVMGYDHADPATLRAKARADLEARYPSISFRNATVARAQKLEDGSFALTAEDGAEFRGKKLIVAAGITDLALDVEGYSECWGYGIFHCLFCHGYEEAGQETVGVLAVGMLSNPQIAMHIIPMAGRLSKNIKIYTNGNEETAEALREQLKATNLPATVESRKIARMGLVSPGSSTSIALTLEGGEQRREGFLVSVPNAQLNGPFVKDLSLELGPAGEIALKTPAGETSVSGCFAAGDIAVAMRAVPIALSTGMCAGAGAAASVQHDAAYKL